MSAIEDELRRMFADPGRTPPAWPDATTRVRAGMRRRQRRRAVTAAGGATVAVLIAVAVLMGLNRAPAPPITSSPSASPSPSGSGDAIAWRDLPVVAYPRALPSPRPDAPACRAADLVFDSEQTGAAAGTQRHVVKVHNGGLARCTLSGRPTLLHTVAGTAVVGPTQPIDEPTADTGITPATIDPGEPADLIIETYGGCAGASGEVVYADIALLVTGGSVFVPGATLDARCGVGMGQWYRPMIEAADHLPWLGLTVSIEAPPTVQLGQTLDYVVTLANPTGEPVPLNPCPNYLQGIAGVKAGSVNQLNCAVAAIPPHGQVRFAMRLSFTAAVGATGPAELDWTLDAGTATGPAPTASTTVTVQR